MLADSMWRVALALAAASFLAAFFFYPQVPDIVASHWDFEGRPDAYMAKEPAMFLFPVLSAALLALLFLLPKIDPLGKNYSAFGCEYALMAVALAGFILYVQLLTIAYNLGYSFGMVQLIAPGLAALFYVAGSVLEKAKQNWFFGIRTPWTLSSQRVWGKTHAATGKMLKVGSAAALVGLAFPQVGTAAALAVAVGAAIFSFIYSYLEFHKERASAKEGKGSAKLGEKSGNKKNKKEEKKKEK